MSIIYQLIIIRSIDTVLRGTAVVSTGMEYIRAFGFIRCSGYLYDFLVRPHTGGGMAQGHALLPDGCPHDGSVVPEAWGCVLNRPRVLSYGSEHDSPVVTNKVGGQQIR